MKNEYKILGDETVIFIKRRNGQVLETIVDTEDLEKIKAAKCSWYSKYDVGTKTFYVRGKKPKENKSIIFHRLITGCPEGLQVDHINHDTLDNRKSNLRIVTCAENLKNRRFIKSKYNMPGFNTTIYWHKGKKRWRLMIRKDGQRAFCKTFKTKEEAIEALNKIKKAA